MKKDFITVSLFTIFLIIGCDTFIVSPLIPLITTNLHVITGNGAYLVTAYSISYVIFSPILGPLSDKIGRKKMIIIGTFIFSISSLLTGLSLNYSFIILTRVFTGIGAAFTAPNVWAYIGDYFEYNVRGKVTAFIASGLSMGMVLGVPIGSFLAQLINWETCFYFLAAMSLIVSISILRYFPDKKISTNQRSDYLSQFTKVFQNRSVVISFFITSLIAIANFGLYTFLGFWLNKQFNLKVSYIGLFIIIAGLGNVLGIQIGGLFSDKISKKKIVFTSLILLVITLLLLPIFCNSLLLTGIDTFLWLGAGGASFSVMQILITQLNTQQRGTVMAFNNSFMWIGTALGSAIVGFIITHFNFSIASGICAVSAFIASILLALYIHN